MIQVSDLAFSYRVGGFLLGVGDFRVERGEKLALVGPSGCGKTTLLNLLAGILAPEKGSIEIAGEEVSTLAPEDRQDLRVVRMGLVFQEFELLEYLNVLDNVLLPYRISPALALDQAAKNRAAALVDEVGLAEKLHRFPRHLSQGERQRVAVCRALVTEPLVLLGDEPTGNLDRENRDLVMASLSRYATQKDAPLVVVTHDHELMDRCDRVIDVRDLAS